MYSPSVGEGASSPFPQHTTLSISLSPLLLVNKETNKNHTQPCKPKINKNLKKANKTSTQTNKKPQTTKQ